MMPPPLQVLIQEADPGDAAWLKDQLSRHGGPVTVEIVAMLREALDRVGRKTYHLVFADPRVSEKATREALRTLASACPVVVLLDRRDAPRAAEILALGAADFLLKNHRRPEAVAHAVTRAVERHRLLREKARLEAEVQRLAASLEARVREEAGEAQQAQRLAAIGQAASHLAHDLRGPLVALELSVDHLRKRAPLDAVSREILEEMGRSLAALSRLVDEVLELAKPQALHLETVDIHALLDEVLGSLHPEALKARVRVLRTYGEGVGPLQGDAGKLQRIFRNLVTNALEAMHRGGELRVRTSRTIQEGRQVLTVTVSDTGPGIPPDRLSQIFNPFYTTKPKGTGLGLPIAQRLVHLHGGRIAVESREGEGTRVTVTLPADGIRTRGP